MTREELFYRMYCYIGGSEMDKVLWYFEHNPNAKLKDIYEDDGNIKKYHSEVIEEFLKKKPMPDGDDCTGILQDIEEFIDSLFGNNQFIETISQKTAEKGMNR